MHVIVLGPNQGTGSYETFEKGNLELPESYWDLPNPSAIYPRAKITKEGKPLWIETCFPILSATSYGGVHFRANSLDELIVHPKSPETPTRIIVGYHIGMYDRDRFRSVIEIGKDGGDFLESLDVNCTCWTQDNGTREGDVHAMINPLRNTIQVVGFVATTRNYGESDLARYLRNNSSNPWGAPQSGNCF